MTKRLLRQHPDLRELLLPIHSERFTGLSRAEVMTTLRISPEAWRHTRTFQETLEEGRALAVAPTTPTSGPIARHMHYW